MFLTRLIKAVDNYIGINIDDLIGSNICFFKKWKNIRKEYSYLNNLIKSIKIKKDLSNKTVVFNIVRTNRNSIDTQVYLGLILALNGAKVRILLDDGVLMHWDTIQINNMYTIPLNIQNIEKYSLNPYYFYFTNYKCFFNPFYSKNIRRKALNTYKNKNLKYIFYSNIIERKKIKDGNLEVLKKHAESSTIRFFKDCDLNYKDKYVKYYYNLSLKNAVLSRNVGKYVFNNIKPDYFITPHGIYSTHGPAYEYLKEKGIKCFVWGGGNLHTKSSVNTYLIDSTTQTLSKSKLWEKYKDTPVTEKMKKKVHDYLKYRQDGSTEDFKSVFMMEKKEPFKLEKNDGYKYQLAMFPHVIWDGNIADRHIAFNGLLDWLIITINYIKKRKDMILYIKSHPAEIRLCNNTPRVQDLIKKHIDLNNFENIILIPPEKRMNTYEFLKSRIDLGIVYDGFLGIEMPYLGIPTITCVKGGFSSVENGNFTVKSKKEYFNYLENIENIIRKFHNNYDVYQNNIIRYLYWYIFKISNIKVPTLKDFYKRGINLYHLKKENLISNKYLLDFFKS